MGPKAAFVQPLGQLGNFLQRRGDRLAQHPRPHSQRRRINRLKQRQLLQSFGLDDIGGMVHLCAFAVEVHAAAHKTRFPDRQPLEKVTRLHVKKHQINFTGFVKTMHDIRLGTMPWRRVLRNLNLQGRNVPWTQHSNRRTMPPVNQALRQQPAYIQQTAPRAFFQRTGRSLPHARER